MHSTHRNVNEAFSYYVSKVHNEEIDTVRLESRNGPVIKIDGPVTITYLDPRERVLFNKARDCNPFFHLVESLWMLAGRRDLATPEYFASNMANYSDDGKTLHGAYGARWRDHFTQIDLNKCNGRDFSLDALQSIDQLDIIIAELRKDPFSSFFRDSLPRCESNPSCSSHMDYICPACKSASELKQAAYSSRRLVLQMWDAVEDLTLVHKNPNCKDVPCNTQAYLDVSQDGYLDLTVCNRSNDLIWGCFGANAVHMSFLLEYLANCSGLKVGHYHQFTNNLHIYASKWNPKPLLKDTTDYYKAVPGFHCPGVTGDEDVDYPGIQPSPTPLVTCKETFDHEVQRFMNCCLKPEELANTRFNEEFLETVARPYAMAFHCHKRRIYSEAYATLKHCVKADDWRLAGLDWVRKRERLFLKLGPDYERTDS